MTPIAASWRSAMPNTRFVAPAPYHYHYAHGAGHQWFGVDGTELQPARITSVRQAFDKLETSSSETASRTDYPGSRSLECRKAPSSPWTQSRQADGSTRYICRTVAAYTVITESQRTEVLLMHGAADTTIPSSATLDAARRLEAAGFPVTHKLFPSRSHTINADELAVALDFLKQTISS